MDAGEGWKRPIILKKAFSEMGCENGSQLKAGVHLQPLWVPKGCWEPLDSGCDGWK